MGQPLFFRKDRKGLPIVRSNMKASKKPSTAHTQVANVVNGPVPDSFKPRFSGTNLRYFVEIDATGTPISGSLISSTNVPEGNYLELFKNNIIGLPLGSNENSGVVVDTPEDLADVPMIMSEDFRINGYRTTSIVR